MKTKIDQILNNIEFKYVNQSDIANNNLQYKFKKYIFYLKALIKYQKLRHFTFYENTNTKINNSEFQNFSNRMKSIEGMSTIANAWIINQIASNLDQNQNYVNIGCWKGFSLIAGMINTKCSVYGVDNFTWIDAPRKEFYDKKQKYIDFYFFDGPHTYKDQYQSLDLASNFFRKGSIILVDDTNWQEPREATKDFISNHASKYEILHDLKCNHARHPTYWNGLIIFQKI